MVTEVFATGFPIDVMFGFRVGFPVELYHNIWGVTKLCTCHTGRTCPKYVILYGPQCTNYGGGQLDQTLCLALGAWCRWLSSELIVSKLSAQ